MTLRNWLRRYKRYFEHKAVVLMYHRVARLSSDPWKLAVHPVHFEQQLQVLKKHFHVIPVAELVKQLYRGGIRSNCVCITFDDGYSDNFINAKPLLEKYHCPAIFFIATKFINKKQMFWWDELQQIMLDTEMLPPVFTIEIDGRQVAYELGDEAVLDEYMRKKHNAWVAPDDPPTKRCELYLAVWELLKRLPDADMQVVLDKIRIWAGGLDTIDHLSMPLTTFQLQDMASTPLFDVGVHTVTHPSLPYHACNIQSQEIVNSGKTLLKVCNHAKNILAYPYGDYDDTTIDTVKKEKLAAAFTTCAQAVTRRSDLFRLGRFQVMDWDGKEFENQLSTWFKT
jgi:Predicted xylanase/chitin deacetylase